MNVELKRFQGASHAIDEGEINAQDNLYLSENLIWHAGMVMKHSEGKQGRQPLSVALRVMFVGDVRAARKNGAGYDCGCESSVSD